ncbi:MAG: hypothetical protein U9Q66_03060 [Patescibacteria group bacterium]|nr:hypothetical protein [Patescibacteria group bacterium]
MACKIEEAAVEYDNLIESLISTGALKSMKVGTKTNIEDLGSNLNDYKTIKESRYGEDNFTREYKEQSKQTTEDTKTTETSEENVKPEQETEKSSNGALVVSNVIKNIKESISKSVDLFKSKVNSVTGKLDVVVLDTETFDATDNKVPWQVSFIDQKGKNRNLFITPTEETKNSLLENGYTKESMHFHLPDSFPKYKGNKEKATAEDITEFIEKLEKNNTEAEKVTAEKAVSILNKEVFNGTNTVVAHNHKFDKAVLEGLGIDSNSMKDNSFVGSEDIVKLSAIYKVAKEAENINELVDVFNKKELISNNNYLKGWNLEEAAKNSGTEYNENLAHDANYDIQLTQTLLNKYHTAIANRPDGAQGIDDLVEVVLSKSSSKEAEEAFSKLKDLTENGNALDFVYNDNIDSVVDSKYTPIANIVRGLTKHTLAGMLTKNPLLQNSLDLIVSGLDTGKVTDIEDNSKSGFTADTNTGIVKVVKNIGEVEKLLEGAGLKGESIGARMIQLLAHEVDHIVTADYLGSQLQSTNEVDSPVTLREGASKETKYLVDSMNNVRKHLINRLKREYDRRGDVTGDKIDNPMIRRLMYAFIPEGSATKNIRTLREELEEQENPTVRQIMEFTAVMGNELPAITEGFNKLKEDPSKGKLRELLDKVIQFIKSFKRKAFTDLHKKTEKTIFEDEESLAATVEIVRRYREKAETNNNATTIDSEFSFIDNPNRLYTSSVDKAYETLMYPLNMANTVTGTILTGGKVPWKDGGSKEVSGVMGLLKRGAIAGTELVSEKVSDGITKRVVEDINGLLSTGHSDSSFVRNMLGILRVNDLYKKDYRGFMDELAKINKEKATIDSDMIHKFKKDLDNSVDSKYFDTLNDSLNKTNIGSVSDSVYSILEGKSTLDEEIKRYEDQITNPTYKLDTDDHANFQVNRVVTRDTVPNFKYHAGDTDILKKTTALKALKLADENLIAIKELYNRNPELLRTFMTMSNAIDIQQTHIRENHGEIETAYTMDVFDKNYDFRVVSHEEFNDNRYDHSKYKVLEAPTKTSYGILYRESTVEYVKGLGTTLNRIKNDVSFVENDILKAVNNGALLVDYETNHFKIPLTKEHKKKLGLRQNPADVMLRTYAHNKELIDSEAVIDRMLDKQRYTIKDEDSKAKLERLIEDKDFDNLPYLLKFEGEYNMNNMTKEVKAQFVQAQDVVSSGDESTIRNKATGRGVADYRGLNKEFSHVRADMKYGILGFKAGKLFNDDSNAAKLETAWVRLGQLFKIHLAIANPIKLVFDGLSNVLILMNKGVSPLAVAQGYSKDVKVIGEYKNLVNEKLRLEILKEGKTTDTKILNRLTEIEDKLSKGKFRFLHNDAFMQSIATSFMSSNEESVSGLQNDVNKVLKKMFRSDDEELNKAGKLIMRFANTGPKFESIVQWLGERSTIGGTGVQETLLQAAEDIKDKKKRNDIEGYMSEFIASPNSLLTKFGTSVVTVNDALAKLRLLEHRLNEQGIDLNTLDQKNYDANKEYIEDSVQEVHDTFQYYLDNTSKGLHTMGQYTIVLFANFWLRAQRPIYLMATQNPLTTLGMYGTLDSVGMSQAMLLNANLINKESQDTILNTSGLTMGHFLPTPAFNLSIGRHDYNVD